MHVLVWIVLSTAFAGVDPALEQEFSLQDLEKLRARGKWGEVILRAKTVPAADQGATWKQVVARSAERYMKILHGDGSLDGLEMAIRLPAEFPFLFTDPAFLAARHEVGAEGLKRCFENPFTADRCTERAKELVRGEKSNDAFLDAVLEVMDRAGYSEGVALVVGEVLNAATAPRLCVRMDFKKGLKALWTNTDWDERMKATRMARSHCYGILEGWLKEKARDGGQVGAEVCRILSRKAERVPACKNPNP